MATDSEITENVNKLVAKGDFCKRYNGNDNSGKPKTEYLKKLILMTDEELREECKNKIWLSAFASNNHRSDYHWHCDACYDECARREKGHIYDQAHKYVSNGL